MSTPEAFSPPGEPTVWLLESPPPLDFRGIVPIVTERTSPTFMDRLEQWVTAVTDAASHPVAFVLAALTVFGWAVSGPFLGFSEVWQLTINTGTTIITFLVGFSILVSTKRDSLALHGKLDHLIRNQSGPNHFVREDEKTTRQIESDRERHDG